MLAIIITLKVIQIGPVNPELFLFYKMQSEREWTLVLVLLPLSILLTLCTVVHKSISRLLVVSHQNVGKYRLGYSALSFRLPGTTLAGGRIGGIGDG